MTVDKIMYLAKWQSFYILILNNSNVCFNILANINIESNLYDSLALFLLQQMVARDIDQKILQNYFDYRIDFLHHQGEYSPQFMDCFYEYDLLATNEKLQFLKTLIKQEIQQIAIQPFKSLNYTSYVEKIRSSAFYGTNMSNTASKSITLFLKLNRGDSIGISLINIQRINYDIKDFQKIQICNNFIQFLFNKNKENVELSIQGFLVFLLILYGPTQIQDVVVNGTQSFSALENFFFDTTITNDQTPDTCIFNDIDIYIAQDLLKLMMNIKDSSTKDTVVNMGSWIQSIAVKLHQICGFIVTSFIRQNTLLYDFHQFIYQPFNIFKNIYGFKQMTSDLGMMPTMVTFECLKILLEMTVNLKFDSDKIDKIDIQQIIDNLYYTRTFIMQPLYLQNTPMFKETIQYKQTANLCWLYSSYQLIRRLQFFNDEDGNFQVGNYQLLDTNKITKNMSFIKNFKAHYDQLTTTSGDQYQEIFQNIEQTIVWEESDSTKSLQPMINDKLNEQQDSSLFLAQFFGTIDDELECYHNDLSLMNQYFRIEFKVKYNCKQNHELNRHDQFCAVDTYQNFNEMTSDISNYHLQLQNITDSKQEDCWRKPDPNIPQALCQAKVQIEQKITKSSMFLMFKLTNAFVNLKDYISVNPGYSIPPGQLDIPIEISGNGSDICNYILHGVILFAGSFERTFIDVTIGTATEKIFSGFKTRGSNNHYISIVRAITKKDRQNSIDQVQASEYVLIDSMHPNNGNVIFPIFNVKTQRGFLQFTQYCDQLKAPGDRYYPTTILYIKKGSKLESETYKTSGSMY